MDLNGWAPQMPWDRAVALGLVPDVSIFRMIAHNETIGASVETVSPEMGELMGRPEGAAFAVASTSASDTLLGIGARTVRATYIDTSNLIKTYDFEMAGIVEVVSTITDAAVVLRLEVLTSGTVGDTTGANVGTLWAGKPGTFVAGTPASGAGNRYASMQIGTGRSQCGAWRVPAGKRILLTHVSMIGSAQKETELWMFAREPGGQWYGDPQVNLSAGVYSDGAVFGTVLPPGTDIEIRAKKVSGTAGADLHVFLHGEQYVA